jgi:hypothetical protein
MQPAPRFKLVTVNRVDLFPSEKNGFLFQWGKPALRVSLFGEAAKQTGVQSAGLLMGLFKLLIGGIADAARFAVHV